MSGLGSKGNNFGLGYGFTTASGSMLSAHSRRKQDDEILAELEGDPTAALGAVGNTNSAAAHAAAQQQQQAADDAAARRSARRKQRSADGSDRRDGGRDKLPTTTLPREDAHRFRATVRVHTHTLHFDTDARRPALLFFALGFDGRAFVHM
jgi:hypothetical protein